MINQNLLLTGDDGYNLTNSLRFRSSASAYLSRTPASASGENQWTFSAWVKRSILTSEQFIIGGNTTTSGGVRNQLLVLFDSNSNLSINAFTNASGYYFQRVSSAVYRDPSAWYHLVVQFDPDNGTSANRIIAYINGQQVSWGTSSDSGAAGSISSSAYRSINNTYRNDINGGYQGGGAPIYFGDGYLAETIMVSGSLVSVSSFGETSATTGVWIPKKYTGTYGTNGFYLPFTDNSALTTSSNVGLGKDFSGNGNYWTTNNISITAGTTYDSMTDVPTLTSATAANYCTLNPLDASTTAVASNGNLKVTNSSSANTGHSGIFCTQAFPTSGLFYYEIKIDSFATASAGGFVLNGASKDTDFSVSTNLYQYSVNSGVAYANGTTAYTGSTLTTGDILGVAVDTTNGALYFAKNNTWQNSGVPTSGASKTGAISFTVANNILPACYVWKSGGGDTVSTNFGQRPFAYTPPTGYVALNTFNLPTPTIGATASTQAGKYMNVLTWSGTGGSAGATRSLTGLGFKPDFVWEKDRASSQDHHLFDSVRGAGLSKTLASNSTNAEGSFNDTLYGYLSSFDSDGMTTTNGSSTWDNWNKSGDTYVGWAWQAGQGTTSSNTQGTITSTVSANTTAGFSIVTYTGNNTSGATVGHGLGVKPSFIVVKKRTGTDGWGIYHTSLGATKTMELNTTGGEATSAIPWNNTEPTSSVIYLNGNNYANSSSFTYVMYCFAQVAGYSAFGSYTGNGSSDGTFVFTGFRPKWIMIKCSSTGGTSYNWALVDSVRSYANVANHTLAANLPDGSGSFGTGVDVFGPYNQIDLLSNGFKLRDTGVWGNASGATYVYACFAENPFKYANAR